MTPAPVVKSTYVMTLKKKLILIWTAKHEH